MSVEDIELAVHPHACGEYTDISSGSAFDVRFIPTRVGNTALDGDPNGFNLVHPHACGEYPCPWLRFSPAYGSSPRVWGIPLLQAAADLDIRFIPTRVGNTRI